MKYESQKNLILNKRFILLSQAIKCSINIESIQDGGHFTIDWQADRASLTNFEN